MQEISQPLLEDCLQLRLQIDDGEFWLRRSEGTKPDVIRYSLVDDLVEGRPFPWIGIALAVSTIGLGPPYRTYCISETADRVVVVTSDMAQQYVGRLKVHLGRLVAGEELVDDNLRPYRMVDCADTSRLSLIATHRQHVSPHLGTKRMTGDRLRLLFRELVSGAPVAESNAQLV